MHLKPTPYTVHICARRGDPPLPLASIKGGEEMQARSTRIAAIVSALNLTNASVYCSVCLGAWVRLVVTHALGQAGSWEQFACTDVSRFLNNENSALALPRTFQRHGSMCSFETSLIDPRGAPFRSPFSFLSCLVSCSCIQMTTPTNNISKLSCMKNLTAPYQLC